MLSYQGKENVFDDTFRVLNSSFGKLKKQSRLPSNFAEILKQSRYQLTLRAHTNAVDYLNEEVDEPVDDLPIGAVDADHDGARPFRFRAESTGDREGGNAAQERSP